MPEANNISNECFPAYKQESSWWIEVLYLSIRWRSCSGINQPKRRLYRQQYFITTPFVWEFHFWAYFNHQNPTERHFKRVFASIQKQVCLLNRGSISLHLMKELWWYQSTTEITILSRILYLNPFCVSFQYLGSLLSPEADKAPF